MQVTKYIQAIESSDLKERYEGLCSVTNSTYPFDSISNKWETIVCAWLSWFITGAKKPIFKRWELIALIDYVCLCKHSFKNNVPITTGNLYRRKSVLNRAAYFITFAEFFGPLLSMFELFRIYPVEKGF